jgi:hypothetical protein
MRLKVTIGVRGSEARDELIEILHGLNAGCLEPLLAHGRDRNGDILERFCATLRSHDDFFETY